MTLSPANTPPEHDLRGLPWFRRMRITTTVVAIVLFGAAVYTVNHDPKLLGVSGLANGIAIVLYALVCVGFYLTKRRFERRIRAHAGKVCISCGYALTPELDNKPCPECGKPINLTQARATWIQTFGGWKNFPPT